MKKLLCGVIGVFVITVATSVRAADGPLSALAGATSWSGFYIGAGLGFRSSDTNVDVTSANTTVGSSSFNLISVAGCNSGVLCVLGEPFNGTSFRFAPYIGYDWQIAPRWVVGLEGDFGIGNQTTTLNGFIYPAPTVLGGNAADSFGVKTTWDASARVRAGFLVCASNSVTITAGGGTVTFGCTGLLTTDGVRVRTDTATAGIAYKFNL